MENETNGQMTDETVELDEIRSSQAEIELEEKPIDYSTFSKKDFVELIKELSKDDNIKKVDTVIKEIKPLFDGIRDTEKRKALEKFLSEGGIEDDFEFRLDESDHQFDALLKLVRDKRQAFFKHLEDQKNEGLRKKNEILEKLRTLVDGEDSPQAFHQFKDLQRDWKNTGPVPVAHLKTLWANYNALIDRFYDHRNIYFELKELDRKRNLEAKKELVLRAAKLSQLDSIQEAVRELNELHNEFKHIGPVPKEDQEILWQNFKSASDALYVKRDSFVATLQQELIANLEKKNQILEESLLYSEFSSDRIKDWNQKTKDILELQKRWDAIGSIPRSKQKDVNKKFWTSFKTFFHNKSIFFKKLDVERAKNLILKEELVARAIELQTSENPEKTANEYKALQQKWKDIGPVPEKVREKIYQQFKEACDSFFNQRRSASEKANQDQVIILEQKELIINQLTQLAETKSGTIQQIQELQSQFNALGFVPKHAVASIKSRFSETVSKAIGSIDNLSEKDRDQAVLEMELRGLRNDPQADRKLFQKEQTIRKHIAKAENDIAVLKNNLTFFERSKNADTLKEEYGNKIKTAEEELIHLKKQLKMLKQPS